MMQNVKTRAKSGEQPQASHPYDLGPDETGTRRRVRSTTVLCVRRNGQVVMAADGQVTMGSAVMKQGARKLRRLYNDKILAGFAGSTADAFSLFSRFEGKLEQFAGNLPRAPGALANDWRTDKLLRQLDALLLVADTQHMFMLSGNGDVIEPDTLNGGAIMTIGSGGSFAQAAAQALLEATELSARDIVTKSMKIAAEICIYTNENIAVEELSPLASL